MSRKPNDDDDEGLSATEIVSGGIAIARTAEHFSPGFLEQVIAAGYRVATQASNLAKSPAVQKLGSAAVKKGASAAFVANKAAATAAPAMIPIATVAVAALAAFAGTEANAKKREKIKADREARKNSKVNEKSDLQHQLDGDRTGKRRLEQELKMTESDNDLQTAKMYAVDHISYDAETKFVVTLGITGDGKSTFCNRLYGDKSDEGNDGPFVTKDSADSETQRIKCQKVKVNNTHYVIVDTPGFDDSKGGDVHHANNLAEHLNAWGGVNTFVLIQNGINIRLKDSIQAMMSPFEANFGANDFWGHLIIILTCIENPIAIKNIYKKKQSLIKKINAVFPESKKHIIPMIPIGFYGYDYSEWRLKLLQKVSDHKVLCNKMTPPLQLLKKERNRLNRKIYVMNNKINDKRNKIANLRNQIATIQHEIDNAASFVLFD